MSQFHNKQLLFPLSGSFIGSLFGTSSYAVTASYALNGGSGAGTGSNATASFTDQSVWTFNHNLGTRLVTIQTVDANYLEMLPQSIELISTSSAIITFPVQKSGWAIASLGGLGSLATDISGLLTTASFNNYTGSNNSQFAGTSSYASTASYALNVPNIDTGSFVTTSSFNNYTGSSLSKFAGTSSFATTASYTLQSVSASFASTASFAPNYVLTSATSSMSVATASYILNAVSASYATTAVSASYFSGSISNAATATTASYALQASNADIAQIAFTAFSAISAQIAGFATNATSASYAILAAGATLAQTANTAATATTAQTALTAITASYLLNNIDYSGSLRLYVAPGGSDSNDGTQPTKPFKTIKAAVASIGAINPQIPKYYTIFVGTGNYEENNPITVPPGVAIVGDNLRTVRLTAANPRKDYFHCHGSNYFYGLRFINMKYPSFAFSFPCSTATGSINNNGQVSSLSIVHSATGYTANQSNLDVGIIIESPDSISGSASSARATVNTDNTGSITAINLTYSGSEYAVDERFHVSIPAPVGQQPYIFASPYVQNCSSITGPFKKNGDQVTAFPPYDQTLLNSIDHQGAGGGIRIDGNLPHPDSGLQSFVADAFTQVNQGGPGHLVTNNGYAQFVSCFTTFCTYGFKVAAGGYANISNSVCDFGDFGLISKKNFPVAYNTASVAEDKTSKVVSLSLINPGNGYSSSLTNTVDLTIVGGGGSGAAGYGKVFSGSLTEVILTATGSGYTTVPTLVFPNPTSGSLLVVATGSVVLSGVTEFLMNLLSGSRGIDISSNMYYSGSNYIVTGVVSGSLANQRKITVFPAPPSIVAPNTASFTQLSNISTGGLVMEYVGSGVTYNSLPKFGGVPNTAAEITEIAPGKIFYSTVDNIGNLKIGPYFGVNQLTGEVTISSDSFSLAGISSIGPFKRNGSAVGVVLNEVSNVTGLVNSQGTIGQDTVPTQYAVQQYIIGQGLTAGNITGNAATATTATNAPNYVLNSATSSFVANSQTSSFVLNSQTSSFVQNSQTSSFVTNNQTSSFVQNSQTSSFVQNSQTSSMTVATASYVAGSVFSSANLALSASFATTASYALNGGVTSIIAGSGISIDQATGNVTVNSTGGGGVFPFNGAAVITGSLVVSGSGVQVTGSLNVTNGITGSLLGTASFATTASYALNAGAGSGFPFSGNAVITGSLLVSGSSGLTVLGPSIFKSSGSNVIAFSVQSPNYVAGSAGTGLIISAISGSTSAIIQVRSGGGINNGDLALGSGTTLIGSFSGSFTGSLAGTASYVTGSVFNSANLALSASYALTASYALNAGGGGSGNGFPFSGSALITGSLLISGSGLTVTGSVNVTNGITGSLFGTATTASNITPAFTAGTINSNYVLTSNGDGTVKGNSTLVFTGTNLGIGKTAPTATLDVVGTTNLSGSLTVTGSLFVTSSAVTLGQFAGNQNGYIEFSVRNTSTGISASGDIAVYADNGTVSNNYIDMGINNSNMTSSYSYFGTDFGNALDSYLYNVGGNLRIGNATSVTPFSQSLYLFSNPTATPNIWITGSQVAIGKSTGAINGTLDISGSTVMTGSLSIDGTLRQPLVIGSQLYAVNLQSTLTNTTGSQTQTALRVLTTFTGSFSGSNTQNLIADFGATSVGTQFSVNDITSGSIYMVNDVSGIPIIEATSNWDVNIYDYPNIILQKTGSSIIISGSLRMTPSSSFILPLTASSAPALGSAYWSGSFLFIYNGTRYMSSSFS